MKKMFSFLLTFTLAFSLAMHTTSFVVRAYGSELDNFSLAITADSTESGLNQENEFPDVPVTRSLDNIEEFSSWDELVTFVVGSNYESTPQTEHLSSIILGLDGMGSSYFGYGIGGIRLSDFHNNDPSSFIAAIDHLVDLYNYKNDHLLYIQYTFSEPTPGIYLQVDFDYSANNQRYPIQYLGQTGYLAIPTYYFASSDQCGSGAYGVAHKSNPLLGEDMKVIVTGVSYLDANDNIVRSKYIDMNCESINNNTTSAFAIDVCWKSRMLHISTTDGIDLGWVHHYAVVDYNAAFPQ